MFLLEMNGADEPIACPLSPAPGNNFQFSHQPASASATKKTTGSSSSKKRNEDLFASTEADFFAAPKKGELVRRAVGCDSAA